jgi:hypothetical protein
MLENNKQYDAKITAYGSGIGKTSNKAYFYIDFNVDGVGMRWFGSPVKLTGELNQLFVSQLAAAGFDAARHSLAELGAGMGSNVLNENGTVKVRAVQKPNGRNEMEWSIAWIGESKKVTKEELAAGLPANIDELMRKAAVKPVRATEDMIPF